MAGLKFLVLDNGKPGADTLLGHTAQRIAARTGAPGVVAALLAAAPPELRLERLGAGPDGLELRAHFLGGSRSRAPAGVAPFDTPEPERY